MNDLRNQNEALKNLENKLDQIRVLQDQTEQLNNQLRVQMEANQTEKDKCQQDKQLTLISLNTLRGEKEAVDRLLVQLRQDIANFTNNQNSSQGQLVNENAQLKQQLAVVSQQLKDCNDKSVSMGNVSSQLTVVQRDLVNCQQQSQQLRTENEQLNQRVAQVSSLSQRVTEQQTLIASLRSEITNYQQIKEQLERFQGSLNENVQLNAQIRNLRDQLAVAERNLA